MKTKMFLLALVIFLLLAIFGTSNVKNVTFIDNPKYWGDGAAGWGTNQAWNPDNPYGGWNGNTMDVIGDPDIIGDIAAFNGQGNLTWIAFHYTDENNHSLYDVSTGNLSVSAPYGANDDQYVLSAAEDNTGAYTGYILQNNYPIGIQNSVLTNAPLISGSVLFTGFPGEGNDGTPRTGAFAYNFNAIIGGLDTQGDDIIGGLDTQGDDIIGDFDTQGDDIIIGWGTTYANGVVYAQVSNPASGVPEPATILLLGLGLIGLSGARKITKCRLVA